MTEHCSPTNNLKASAAFYQIDIKRLVRILRQMEIGRKAAIATMSSCIERLYSYAQQAEARSDPWKRVLERVLPANVQSISTVCLLELLDVPHTTGNARRLAQTMRAMGWVGVKSRRLMPGGFRDTTIRGWARPHRDIQIRKTSTPDCPAYDRGE
jgi:hypothetical protein